MNLATRPERLLPAYTYKPNIKCAGHLTIGLDPDRFYETLHDIIRVLNCHDFDAIAFRGLSGALFAPTVAMQMGKTLLAVRKSTSNCHSSRLVEGDYNARRYVILDDFVSSGETVRQILEEIHDVMPNAECLGVCEYKYIKDTTSLKSVSGISKSWVTSPSYRTFLSQIHRWVF